MNTPPDDELPAPLSGRVSLAKATIYELASGLSARAAMLANGAPAKVVPGVGPKHSPLAVAQRELREGVLPMFVERPAGLDKGTLHLGGVRRR